MAKQTIKDLLSKKLDKQKGIRLGMVQYRQIMEAKNCTKDNVMKMIRRDVDSLSLDELAFFHDLFSIDIITRNGKILL